MESVDDPTWMIPKKLGITTGEWSESLFQKNWSSKIHRPMAQQFDHRNGDSIGKFAIPHFETNPYHEIC